MDANFFFFFMCQAYPHEKPHGHDREHHHHHDIIDLAAKIAASKMKGKTNNFSIILTYSPKFGFPLDIVNESETLKPTELVSQIWQTIHE